MTNDPSHSDEALDLPAVSHAAFGLSYHVTGEAVVVRLAGNADSDVAPLLGDFLERLHAEVLRTGKTEVVLDFRELLFLTSSCMKYLVVAIKRLTAPEESARYGMRLVGTRGLRWQELSFEVLCQVAPGRVRIDRH